MNQSKPIVTPSEILDAMSGKRTGFSEYYPDTNQRVLRGITLLEHFAIDRVTCQTHISFVDCHLFGSVHIHGGTFNGFSISGGRMTKPLVVYGGTFNRGFQLQEIDALDMESDVYCSVGFWGGEFNCNIQIYKGAFQEIIIGGALLKGVSISAGALSYFNHELEPYIKKLTIAPKQIGVLEVDDFKVGHLALHGVLEKGLYSFANLEVNQLELRSFINLGRVRLDGVTVFRERSSLTGEKKDPSLSMLHTNLGQMRFSEIDLTNFARVEISDCTLVDVESSNTRWFSSPQLNNLGNEGKRDLFRQLKHAMIRQGNRIDELIFQALEMDAYRKTLSFRKNSWDLFVLLIEKYTNNFGNNYILPAIWIVVLSVVVFQCSLWTQGLSFVDKWGGIFVVMNPAHPIDYLVPKGSISNAFMAVDFVGRILISILIYQLITSFRKFVRR